jgi:hypothetical protein
MQNNNSNWFFCWVNGGFNTVSASSFEDALEKAQKMGQGWGGVVDENSLTHDPKYRLTEIHMALSR